MMNMVKRLIVLLLMCAMVVLTAACAVPAATSVDQADGLDSASAWPFTFSTVSLSGEEITESAFAKNKLTILNVFATWCPPCVAELPDLGLVAAEYAGKGVQLVGLLEDGVVATTGKPDDKVIEQANTLLANAKAEYLVILPDAALREKFFASLQYVPTTFFLDETGTVVETLIGSRSAEEWANQIDAVLAKLGSK
ncbi:MAG: TlpA family protein disulfide reductase [Oscillospiraceae bacterium]|jgi:thiol-disulfide isomerase/thioredoxin|nr:TlpA family protein disulfide reductase [Oscillospiraceae bacterium]